MSFWILDTDSVSLFQRGNLEIALRLNNIDKSEIAITIVTVEEQIRGRFQAIRRAAPDELVSAYQKPQVTFDSLKSFNVLGFTTETKSGFITMGSKTGLGVKWLRLECLKIVILCWRSIRLMCESIQAMPMHSLS